MMPQRIHFTLLALLLAPGAALAASPESPEVKAMVGRGLDFLQRSPVVDAQPGGKALVALAFVKSNKPDHPLVKDAIKLINSKDFDWRRADNYSLGLCIILLSEVNERDRKMEVMQRLVDELLSRQKGHGGWGYDSRFSAELATGDISQTQYAVLALWSARLTQAKVPQEAIEKVCDWLVRVQDPGGGWGYQGMDPGSYQRTGQGMGGAISHSLNAAGLGSVCICADLLGIHRPGSLEREEQEDDPKVPGALKIVKKPKAEQAQQEMAVSVPLVTKMDPKMVDRAIEDGTKWFEENYAIETKKPWNLYYLYGLERCESFRNLYYRKFPKDHKWYNDGVAFLSRSMQVDHWSGDHIDPVATAFCILFLQRSAQKLFSMISGAILTAAQGSLAVSELSRLASLTSQINVGDILVGDRGFGSYPVIAWLKHGLEVDFIGRTTRGVAGRRRHKRLGPNDWLMVWKFSASARSPWLNEEQRKQLPREMIVRTIKGKCQQKGFRVRGVTVVTTLLDPELYPAGQILAAYLRRGRLERCLDDLKTTLKMDTLRGRTPAMAQKEMYMRLIGQNLIRCVAGQAAGRGEVPLERISFKGTLDALRQYTQALSRARTRKKWRELWDGLLQTLAADLVPERPGRREPRAVKRKKNKYERLNTSRKKYRDRPKRNTRRKTARLRRLGLM